MPYDVTLVQVSDRPHAGCAITVPFPNLYNGFPSSPFTYLLASMWICLPGAGGAGSGTGPSYSFFTIDAVSATNEIEVQLYDSTGAIIYDATYSAAILGVRSNIILSVDSVAQIAQLYLNDAPLTVTGGPGWTGAGPFHILNTSSRQNLWDFEYDGIFFDPAAGDMWAAAPGSFFDLTTTSNRRKFISDDLTPVDLGANGSNPLGTQPPVFLTVPSAGVASDIRNNYGSGGTFSGSIGAPTISFQTPGTCTLPPTPPPGVPSTSCGDVHSPSSFTASWTPTGATPVSYTLDYRKVGTVSFTEITGIITTSYLVSGLQAATNYEFKVQAVNGGGASAFSDLIECSTTTGVIRFLVCGPNWTITQPVSVVYGLDHLAGMTITGLIDGIVLPPTIVNTDGSLDLPFPASSIKLGLGFTAQVQTPYLDTGAPTIQGRRKDIVAVTVRVDTSAVPDSGTNQPDGGAQVPPSVGPPWVGMLPGVTQDPNLQPQTYIGPSGQVTTKLFSGDFRANTLPGWNEKGQVAVQQTKPLPLGLVACIPEGLEGDIPEQTYSEKSYGRDQQQPAHPRPPGAWMLRQ